MPRIKNVTKCPCEKTTNCFTSKEIDYKLCMTCGLQSFHGDKETDLKNLPQSYSENILEVNGKSFVPYYQQTNTEIVYLDKQGDKYKWVAAPIDIDEDGIPNVIMEEKFEFEQNEFYSVLELLQSIKESE